MSLPFGQTPVRRRRAAYVCGSARSAKRERAGLVTSDRAGYAWTCVSPRGLFLYNRGMTAEEKTSVAFFIDLASDMARGGYSRGKREYKWVECTPDPSSVRDGSWSNSSSAAQSTLVMVICDTPEAAAKAGEEEAAKEAAGLLDKMLGSIGLSGENCFVTGCTGCEDAVRSRKPRFILCMGERASRTLLQSQEPAGAEPVEKTRGKLIEYKTEGMTIPLVATYHPGDLLRDPGLKRRAWDDLKMFRAIWRDATGDAAPESAVSGATGGAE